MSRYSDKNSKEKDGLSGKKVCAVSSVSRKLFFKLNPWDCKNAKSKLKLCPSKILSPKKSATFGLMSVHKGATCNSSCLIPVKLKATLDGSISGLISVSKRLPHLMSTFFFCSSKKISHSTAPTSIILPSRASKCVVSRSREMNFLRYATISQL